MLLAVVTRGQHAGVVRHVAGAQLDADRHALALPLGVLPAGAHVVAVVDLHEPDGGLEHLLEFLGLGQHQVAALVVAPDGHDHGLALGHLGRDHQAGVVAVAHDQRADQPRAHAPARGPHELFSTLAGLVLHFEGLGEVLTQVVARARLQRLVVLHHAFDGERLHRAGETLAGRLGAAHHRHRQNVFGEPAVALEHLEGFLAGLLGGGVGGVPLLPQEFGGAQEQARAHFPAHDVGPLVDQHRQIAVALDPLAVRIPDDRLAGGPDDQLFLQLRRRIGHHGDLAVHLDRLQARVRDDSAFLGEALHVLGFLGQEALRNEQREVGVDVAQLLEAVVQPALHHLPDAVAVGPDDHAAAHRAVFGQFGGLDHVQVPAGVVDAALGNVGHGALSPGPGSTGRTNARRPLRTAAAKIASGPSAGKPSGRGSSRRSRRSDRPPQAGCPL